jgi:hypothetical protein
MEAAPLGSRSLFITELVLAECHLLTLLTLLHSMRSHRVLEGSNRTNFQALCATRLELHSRVQAASVSNS